MDHQHQGQRWGRIFQGLMDLREKYPGDVMAQNFALMRTYPVQFSKRDAEKAPSHSADVRMPDTGNLDAAVILLRHLYHVVALRYRGDSDTSSEVLCQKMTEEESTHPLLQFVWVDFEDEAGAEKQSIVRYEMLKDAPDGKATVYGLLENESMWKTLWRREPFLLYHPTILKKPRGAAEWDVVPCEDTVGLVKESLVSWDGAGNLGDRISGLFDSLADDETNAEFLFPFSDPAVIRVKYDHTTNEGRKSWEDLKTITMDPNRLENNKPVTYALIASARCAKTPDGSEELGADRIRLFDVLGQPLILPMEMKHCASTYWSTGQGVGCMCLLFYARKMARDTSGGHELEVPSKADNLRTTIKAMKTSLIPIQSGSSSQGTSSSTPAGRGNIGLGRTQDRDSLANEVDRLKTERDNHLALIDKQARTIEDYQATIERQAATIDEKQAKIDSQEATLEARQAKIAELDQGLVVLKSQMDKALSRRDDGATAPRQKRRREQDDEPEQQIQLSTAISNFLRVMNEEEARDRLLAAFVSEAPTDCWHCFDQVVEIGHGCRDSIIEDQNGLCYVHKSRWFPDPKRQRR
ncbi:hypothetical protein F4779DRAFT_621319 [Xylariaceae sp. FL0662B]|nr:hypothetical protein F4779DRAFT_621319 [Xylariaceae sp. FL0662B]